MRIIILQGAFLPVPPRLGGAVEKMWFALGKEFVRMGHEVIHVSRTYEDLPDEEWVDGVHHIRVRGYATPSSGLYLKWLDLLYSLNARKVMPSDCDIIVTNTFWAPLLLPAKLKRRCMIDVQRMPKGQMRWYKTSARFRANSTPVTAAIKQELPVSYHKKVIMIPNPLPFYNLPEIDIIAKKKVLLYVGRIHPEKGLEILLKAFKAINTGWTLKIVGPWETSAGGGGMTYLNFLKNYTDTKAVEFIGPVFDTDKLNQYYHEASIFIYPSIAEQGETFGLAPLEAMAWGCVPITSDLACFQDFIRENHNGLVFNHRSKDAVNLLKDAIFNLQQNSLLRFRLAQEARKVTDTHSSSSIASIFLDEFDKMRNEQNYN